MRQLSIFCNTEFPEPALAELKSGCASHRLIISTQPVRSNLVRGKADPMLQEADVVFGQPAVGSLLASSSCRWIQLTSAGYTAYDRPDLRADLTNRGAVLTNSSSVYAEPCAEHVLAWMLALSRRVPHSARRQVLRGWPAAETRASSTLLRGQSVLLLGFGATGRRLAELLAPFQMEIVVLRRTPDGTEPVEVIGAGKLPEILGTTRHLVNLLPLNPSTVGFVNAELLSQLGPGARFYNVGRGQTVDQQALREALQSGHLDGAALDVTDPEPLPEDHPLWRTRNCWITPHCAGGQPEEFQQLVRHFLRNLKRFVDGEPLLDRVLP